MPFLQDDEMAAVLDPALKNPGFDDDEEEAITSQLMASMEQNTLAFASNTAPRITLKSPHVQNGHDTEMQMENTDRSPTSSQETQQKSAKPASNSSRKPSRSPAVNHSSRKPSPPPQQNSSSEVTGDNGKGTPTESEETSGIVVEQEDEDFKSASSKLLDEEVVAPELAQADGESKRDTENSESGSEDEIDFCLFCNLKDPEDDNAGEDLSCAICRRPAHMMCATSQNALPSETSALSWTCPTCIQEHSSESPKDIANKARQSASRLVRDLLPVSRGMQKPGAHSIFAQTLIQDEDGGRALRKRKSPSAEHQPRPEQRKKRIIETPRQDRVPEPENVSHSTRRASQKLALGMPPVPTARVLQHRPFHKPPPHKFILAFKLEQSKIEAILAIPPKPNRRRYTEKKKQKIPAPPPYQAPVPKFPALPTHNLIFPSMFGDRETETNAKPYGGILSEAEAETSRSLPQMRDREIFEIARKEAEEERKKTSAKAEAEMNGLNGEGGANATSSKRTVSGPPSKIKCIQFGKFVIDTSYAAPYPEEYSHESRLFICEFCLKYLPSEFVAWRHKLKCPAKHPPGDEIYRDGSLSIWEVDGRKKTEYCQCLCLMAKLFLGSKTLYYDVDPFLFYVLTEFDEFGYHFVGYFSKEKRPASQNNVSCILVMPIHQRKGYATFLIEFSYLLTRIEGKEGSPEKPLSDMGLTAYRSYWDLTISKHLLDIGDKPFSIKDMMERTGMTADDVVHSLERLYAFVKDPLTKAYAIRYDRALYKDIVDKYESKDFRHIKPERLVWTPYIMGRSDAAMLDAQPITAVAQREEDVSIEVNVGVQTTKDGTESEDISPKTSKEPSRTSPTKPEIDPALVNEVGTVAPGPPSMPTMDGNIPTLKLAEDATPHEEDLLTNGVAASFDKGKTAMSEEESHLSGYALTYRIEKIPPSRYQIDPPIPAAMLRKSSARRKSTVGTPRANGMPNGKPSTPQPIRSSPRKAGSVNGSVAGVGGSSRGTSPDKAVSASVRRSGRRSGLANEIVTTTDASADDEDEDEDEEDDEDAIMEDDEEEDEQRAASGAVKLNLVGPLDLTGDESDGASVSGEEEDEAEDERSEGSGNSSVEEDDEDDEEEESNASDDPDAIVDEDEDDDDDSEVSNVGVAEVEEEEEDDDDDDSDVPSAVSSPAAAESADEGSGSSDEED